VKDIGFLRPRAARCVGCNEPMRRVLAAIIERLAPTFHASNATMLQTPTVGDIGVRELRDRRVDLDVGTDKGTFSDESSRLTFYIKSSSTSLRESEAMAGRQSGAWDLIDEAWSCPRPYLARSARRGSFSRVRSTGAARERRLVVLICTAACFPTGRYLARSCTVLRYGALRSAVKVLAVEFPIQPRLSQS